MCVFVCVFLFSLGDGDGLVGGWQSGDSGELPNEEQVLKCWALLAVICCWWLFHSQDLLLRRNWKSWRFYLQLPSLITNHWCRLRRPRTRGDQEQETTKKKTEGGDEPSILQRSIICCFWPSKRNGISQKFTTKYRHFLPQGKNEKKRLCKKLRGNKVVRRVLSLLVAGYSLCKKMPFS